MIGESALTRGRLRKLNVLPKSVSDETGERAFAHWFVMQPKETTDGNADFVADTLWPLIEEGRLMDDPARRLSGPAVVVEHVGRWQRSRMP